MMYNNKWIYSLDEERFDTGDHFDTKDEAIEAAKQYAIEEEADCVYIGQCKGYKPYVDVDSIIEQVCDNAYDEVGEVSEDFLCDLGEDASNDLEEKINQVFNEWLVKYNLEPNFHSIVNMEEIEICD